VQAISRKGQDVFDVGQVPDAIGYYFAGFVDGEGSFHLTFRRRQDYKLPWKVSLCLNVSQKDKVILALLKRHLQCGEIRYKSGDVWMYEVNNLNAIRSNVIPFFCRFGFLSAKKKRDFAIFQRMAELMAAGAHLSRDGIESLLKLRLSMNWGGKRKYSDDMVLAAFSVLESSETTCQTPSVDPADGDDIVRSAMRVAEPGRNDLAQRPDESSDSQAVE
jgi:LAGLIDADG DNA endonuclease family protein